MTPFHRRGYQRIRAMLEGQQLALDLGEGTTDVLEGSTDVIEGPADFEGPSDAAGVREPVVIPIEMGAGVT